MSNAHKIHSLFTALMNEIFQNAYLTNISKLTEILHYILPGAP